MEEVMEAFITDFIIKCPHCGENLTGWLADPRGTIDCCDYCKKSFKISRELEFELY